MRVVTRYPGFRNMFVGQLLSQFGNAVFLIMGLWEIQLRSPFLLSVAGLALSVPNLLAVLGGAVVDRYDPRRIMLWTDVLRGVAVGLGMLALVAHLSLVVVVIVLLAVNSLGSALFSPAELVVLPWLVDDRDLGQANGVYALTFQLSGAVGSFIGGAAIAAIGVQVIFGADLASFWLSALAVGLMMRTVAARPRSPDEAGGSGGQNLLALLQNGFRGLSHMPWLVRLFPAVLVTNFSFTAAFTMFPYWCRHVLHLGAVGYGAVDASWALGLVVGSLIVGRFSQWSFRNLMTAVSLVMGLCVLVFAGMTVGSIAAVLLGLAGVVNAILNAVVTTMAQRLIPEELRGRAFGLFATLVGLVQPLGSLAAGLLLHVLPLWWPWAMAGTAGLVLALAAARTLPRDRIGGSEPGWADAGALASD